MFGILDEKTKSLSQELFKNWINGNEERLSEFVRKEEVNSDVISRFLILVEGFELAGNTNIDKQFLESRIRSYKNI